MVKRLGELEERQSLAIGGQMADFALVVSEVDGGLSGQITARRPGGGGEEHTAAMIRLAAAATGFTLLYASPDLSRALFTIRIAIGDGEVRAETVLSQTSLLDAVDTELSRRREIRDLRARLHAVWEREDRERALARAAAGANPPPAPTPLDGKPGG